MNERRLAAVVDDYRARIARVDPRAETALSGGALIGDATHDVDLVVLVDDVAATAALLRAELPPLYEEQWRDDWAAFRDPGPPQVDIVLTVRGSRGDAHHRRAWELLLARPDLCGEYERAKAAGMSSEQKRFFFERVVALLDE